MAGERRRVVCDNAAAVETRNAETVTVPRAEYKLFQTQSERISALEKQVELLTEALRLLVRHTKSLSTN